MAEGNPTDTGGGSPPGASELRAAREDAAALLERYHRFTEGLHRRALAGDPTVLDLRTEEERAAFQSRRRGPRDTTEIRHIGRELRQALEFIDGRGGLRIPTFPDWLRDLYATFPPYYDRALAEQPLGGSWGPEWPGLPEEGDVQDWVDIIWRAAIGREAKRQSDPVQARRRLAERYAPRWRVIHGRADWEGRKVKDELVLLGRETGHGYEGAKILSLEVGISLAVCGWETRREIRLGRRGRGQYMRPGELPSPIDAPDDPPPGYLQLFKKPAIAWLLDRRKSRHFSTQRPPASDLLADLAIDRALDAAEAIRGSRWEQLLDALSEEQREYMELVLDLMREGLAIENARHEANRRTGRTVGAGRAIWHRIRRRAVSSTA